MHALLEFLLVLCKIFYFYLEAIVRIFVPVAKKSIKGQNVLVTGGGRGIGRELAIAFSKQDTNIILWDIDKDGLKETAEELRIRGVNVTTYICDVTKRDDVISVAADVRKDVGDVDILVNNAGILVGKYIQDLTERDIRRTYEVNTISHFWTVQEFLPAMMRRRTGHIVTIASMAGHAGTPMLVDYSGSKFAAVGFTEALRMELRVTAPHSPIYTTTICPMFVNTNLIFGDEVKSRVGFQDRFGKMLQPEDVANSTVDGVLRNVPVVYVPKQAVQFKYIKLLFPEKAQLALMDFAQVGFVPAKKD